MAAPRPIAPAMGGVPGSNRHGRSFQVARSSQTSRMISLPPKNGSERLQHLAPAVEHADAGRGAQLVPREGVEVGAERRHVDREVRRRLGAVEEDPGPRRLGALDDLRDGVDRAEHVRDVGERHEPRPPREEALERLEVERPLVGHGHVPEAELPLAGEQDPGHQVRVVLHLRQEDLVPRDERAPRPRVDDDVDRLRRPLREDDLLALPRPEKRPHPVPGALVELRRLLAQRVDRAVDVGVRPLVEEAHRVEDRPRLLGRRRRVEVHEPAPLDRAGEDREVRDGPARRGSPPLSRAR